MSEDLIPECLDCDVEKRFFPPCRLACPADVNVQAYISLISQGRFDKALEIIRRDIPFPAVCGRVCFAPCEDACQRNNVDNPVSIRLLKRLVTNHELSSENVAQAELVPQTREEKIAVIGSGPAGLTAAYELVKRGYPVTVFERDSKLGGMLKYCLPLYRLPGYVLDSEIKYITDTGVKIKTNVEVGEDLSLEDIWDQDYKAIFVAVGTPKSYSLNIPGENLKGVLHALEFLTDAHLDKKMELKGKVVVIGGGDVAVDSARTAVRLGPDEVTLIYRRLKDDMPANPKEVEEMEREGVKFMFLSNPTKILGDECVKAVECVKMRLGEPDDSGRRRPIPISGSEFVVPTDFVIEAIGETTDLSFLLDQVNVSRRNTIEADLMTCETNLPGVFAGGDVVTGPLSVIDAIAAGKKAAKAIDLYLMGEDLDVLRVENIEETSWVKEGRTLEEKPRQEESYLPLEKRRGNFREVELGFTREQGMLEALRCVHCGPCAECLVDEGLCEQDCPEIDENLCSGCGICVSVCPFDAMEKDVNGIARVNEEACKGCGICASSCPERAISMKSYSDDFLIKAVAG